MADNRNIVLSAKDIEVKFRVRDNYLTAIRGVSLDLYEGETFAIVGESGSGKSVSAMSMLQLLDGNGYIAVHLINALNTGGLQITTQNKAKGQFAFEFTGHYSIKTPEIVPYELYIKQEIGA